MTPDEIVACAWIVSDDTGTSSKTIWAVMMGVPIEHPSIPHDRADFGRCYRLIEAVPSWKARLPEVAAAHPSWRPIIDEWEAWTRRYLAWWKPEWATRATARITIIATDAK